MEPVEQSDAPTPSPTNPRTPSVPGKSRDMITTPEMATAVVGAARLIELICQPIVAVIAVGWVIFRGGQPLVEALAFWGAAVPIAAAVALPMIGYFLRMQAYKRHWVGQSITPWGYAKGNIALFLSCELVVWVMAVGVLVSATWWGILAVAVSWIVVLLNPAHGRPMEADHASD